MQRRVLSAQRPHGTQVPGEAERERQQPDRDQDQREFAWTDQVLVDMLRGDIELEVLVTGETAGDEGRRRADPGPERALAGEPRALERKRGVGSDRPPRVIASWFHRRAPRLRLSPTRRRLPVAARTGGRSAGSAARQRNTGRQAPACMRPRIGWVRRPQNWTLVPCTARRVAMAGFDPSQDDRGSGPAHWRAGG
jgi:hypothetical protein